MLDPERLEVVAQSLTAVLGVWLGLTVLTRFRTPLARVFAFLCLTLVVWSGSIIVQRLSTSAVGHRRRPRHRGADDRPDRPGDGAPLAHDRHRGTAIPTARPASWPLLYGAQPALGAAGVLDAAAPIAIEPAATR